MEHFHFFFWMTVAWTAFIFTVPPGSLQQLLIDYAESLNTRLGRHRTFLLGVILFISPILNLAAGADHAQPVAIAMLSFVAAAITVIALIDIAIFLLRRKAG